MIVLRALVALAVMVAAVVPTSARAQRNEESARIIELYTSAMAALGEGDIAAYGDEMERALAFAPGHPVLMRHVARARAREGQWDDALEWLRRVVATGVDLGLGADEHLESLRGRDDFERLLADVEVHKQPLGEVTLAFSLEPRDMLPEGIAYDAGDDVFYVGSIRYGKIYRVSRTGRSSVFAAPAGMDGVLGLRVDPRRRYLWAVAGHMPGVVGYTKENDGMSEALRFDLEGGMLLARYPLSNADGAHNLNDVVVSSGGTAYMTDAATGAIYTVDPERDRLEVMLEAGTTYGPNGLVLSHDERRLYVAQYALGIVVVDLDRLAVAPLRYPEDVVVCGVDGLYCYGGALVGVQNYAGLQQVSLFRLNGGGDAIVGGSVVVRHDSHFLDPTTGALVGNRFFAIANSQLPRIGDDGVVPAADAFDKTFILEITIPDR